MTTTTTIINVDTDGAHRARARPLSPLRSHEAVGDGCKTLYPSLWLFLANAHFCVRGRGHRSRTIIVESDVRSHRHPHSLRIRCETLSSAQASMSMPQALCKIY